jgi:thymidylate kinase
MTRLILVEGFPGAGKSTTAQFLARQLARRGARVRWIYEGESANPLVPGAPAGGHQSWEQLADRRVARWRAFAAAAAEEDVTVVPESALLQLPVFTMLRRNVDPSLITALVGRLVEAVAPLRPTLVYLARRDPEVAFRAIGEQRGITWLLHHMAESGSYQFIQTRGLSGLDGLLAYWRAHADLCGTIVERIDLPKLVLEVGANGWAERRRRICDFLEVPYREDLVADPPTIARVTGRFSDGKREVTVESVAGRLVMRGLWRSNALLPIAPDVFDVESLPVRLNFVGDTAERIDAFHCSGPRLWWAAPAGVFRRV